jgi:group I intron endonuclease
MIGIYKITSPSGKVYIGQSINIKKRISNYKSTSCKKQSKLYHSIKKHGWENHKFEVIEECVVHLLNERERYWQDYYNVINENGLNCRLQNCTDKSGFLSKETILNISKSRSGITPVFKNPELRMSRIKQALTGKKLSESHKMSLSKAQTGLKRSTEAIMKSAKSRTGLKFGEDFKKKISKAQTGGNNSFAKITLNIETGIFYETAKQAAESLGWSYNKFNHYMNGRTIRKLPFIYV